jgi:hypothetical protein
MSEIPGRSVNVVVSIGALNRAGTRDRQLELLNDAYRVLKPGGLFVFMEPDGDGQKIPAITTVFPKDIIKKAEAGEEEAGGEQQKKRGKRKKASKAPQEDPYAYETPPPMDGTSLTESLEEKEEDRAAVVLPGVTFERLQNFADPYITGIAVRPP